MTPPARLTRECQELRSKRRCTSMASRGRFDALWNRDGLPPAVRALALIALAGGLSGLLRVGVPGQPGAPVDLLRMAGVVALAPRCFSGGSATGSRTGSSTWPWSAERLITVLIARSATGVGMIVTACDYMWMGVYAAFFFSRRPPAPTRR